MDITNRTGNRVNMPLIGVPAFRDQAAKESIPAFLYATGYLVYLWFHQESETWHWLTLVLLPVGMILLIRRDWRTLPASFGLTKKTWKNKIGLAAGAGVAISLLQLVIGARGKLAIDVLSTPTGWLLLPVALLLLFLTAGFTEEVFFRGFLQTRLEARLKSTWMAIGIVTILFSVYHIPYAYLNPNWSSAGDLPAAISSAFAQGIPGGIILGWLYKRSDHNLVACVVLHSMINWFPALTMIKINGG